MIEAYFRDFRSNGHPFDQQNAGKYAPVPPAELGRRLLGIEGKTKKSALLKLVDLCWYPVARGKDRPADRVLGMMRTKELLIDVHLPEAQRVSTGIKYYCFD